jgi:hypothetical protein
MNSVTPHPDQEILLRLVDDDLSPHESRAIGDHLLGCADCRGRLAALRETLDHCDRFHREVLKPAIPPPPGAWALELPVVRSTRFQPMRWLAAAAAIAAVFILVYRLEFAPEVRAAELLRKAAVSEKSVAVSLGARRIRIRTRSRTLDRAARVSSGSETGDTAAFHAMFDAARYSWEDPLSAAAFSLWRDGLPKKEDRIDESAGFFLVRTSSPEGALSDGALTLRASDLHAVACTLRLRSSGETIDMTELAEETPSVPTATPQSRSTPVTPSPEPMKAAGAGDELHVIAALHRIGADLGEPVEVRRDGGSVVIVVTGLEERRRNQIREAVSGIAAAQLRLENSGVRQSGGSLPPSRTPVPPDKMNPLIADLHNPDLGDQLIDYTDRATERAYALRSLARRFQVEAISQLSIGDLETLRSILNDHAAGLAGAVQEIHQVVAPILPISIPPPEPTGNSWQSLAESLPGAVDRLDRVLNGATDASEARKSQLAVTLAQLSQRAITFQRMVRQ